MVLSTGIRHAMAHAFARTGVVAVFVLVLAVAASPTQAAEAPPLLRAGAPVVGDVQLVSRAKAIDLYIDDADHTVAKISADLLARDIAAVSGIKPRVISNLADSSDEVVLVGTVGQSKVIDALIADGRIDVTRVRGKWETFLIATIESPLPNFERALVIVGSDRRGTAFGVLEVSEQIGVSPWYWWSDVPPTRRESLTIASGTHIVGPPSVKYRGIFINDEDWGLVPWAANTFEHEHGNIGPKTYAKVFELLLRLKANYLWPAMHPVATEFGAVVENLWLADDWAIVIGASHAEPMNRNNVHWNRENRGPWRYDTNRDRILDYWDEWASRRGKYEVVWSVGMRGIHDSGMGGPKDVMEQAKLLSTVIRDQRELLKKHVDPKIEAVPQIFTPYKEALSQYQAGLEVPDDVTLVWADDNYGHIRQLSTPEEQKRTGRSGVYYHLSYLGRPKPYLWIHTTPPALIWTQMRTAFEHGADRVWVANIGDIKPGEIGMEFWTKLAWNVDRYSVDAQSQFLSEWATREFGADHAKAIAAVMNDYYQLAAPRKPEMMERGVFSTEHYREAELRLSAHETLMTRAEAIAKVLPTDRQDAYFELVLYPVRVAALTNVAYLSADLDDRGATTKPSYRRAAVARARLELETAYFNDVLAGGKWSGFMRLTGFGRTGEYTNWSDDWFMQWPAPASKEANLETLSAPTTQPTPDAPATGPFVEIDGVVAMEAEHFSREQPIDTARWASVPGLGRTGPAAVTVMPSTAPSIDDPATLAGMSPTLEYDFDTTTGNIEATLHAYCLPTYRLHDGRGLRYAVAIDDGPPQIVDVGEDGGATGEHGQRWLENTRRNLSIGTTKHAVGPAGRHTLRLWMVDPGVVVDKWVLDLGGLRPSDLGPPETRSNPAR